LGQRMPVTGACLRVAALSISGVPPLNGFWSKLIIVLALVLGGFYTLAAVTVGVSFVTLLSFAKVQRYILGGDPSEAVAQAREVPLGMCVASVVLATLCFASSLMILPAVKERLVDPAIRVLQTGPRADGGALEPTATVAGPEGSAARMAAGPAEGAGESP